MIRARGVAPLVAMGVAALALAACGGDDEPAADDTGAATTTEATAAPQLDGVKDYLLDHSEQLTGFTADFKSAAEEYHALAEEAGFDYEALWAEHGEDLAPMLEEMKANWIEGNPYYERMEGVVAGTPSLAEYDVILDAGSSAAEDPESAVPFDLELSDGTTLEQPGQPLQPHRGRPLGDAPGGHAAEHARRPGRQRDGGLRRGAAGRAVPARDRRGVRPLLGRARRLGARPGSRASPTRSRPSS